MAAWAQERKLQIQKEGPRRQVEGVSQNEVLLPPAPCSQVANRVRTFRASEKERKDTHLRKEGRHSHARESVH